jgi:probable F420-dependent oxidoreductase
MDLGRIGVWLPAPKATPELAATIERAGYGTLWLGASPAGDLRIVDELLDATDRLSIATGIVNVWKADARTVAASYHRIEGRVPDRFLLGIGVGHPESTSDYTRPYKALTDYLDVLDAEGVAPAQRVVAALGPKVLQLSADRSAGAHPYLTTPQHTADAREQLGAGVLLAPEQGIALDPDPQQARAHARQALGYYLRLTNYVSNWRRLGFGDDDFADGGSDALVDALISSGPTATQRVRDHLDAGADHVAVQLIGDRNTDVAAGLLRIADELGMNS